MGRELIERYDVFRHSLAEAGNYLKELGCAWELLGIVLDLTPNPGTLLLIQSGRRAT
jgi:hypothetical protein